MKVGSIVECINDSGEMGIVRPKKGKPYTVRDIGANICKPGVEGLRLEEIINGVHPHTGKEFAYYTWRFRELLPPMEIQDALDSCEPILIELNK